MRGVNYDRQREDYQTVCKTGFHRTEKERWQII